MLNIVIVSKREDRAIVSHFIDARTIVGDDEDDAALGVFERKILRNIYGPLRVGKGDYRRRFNDDLYELYNDIDIVQ